MIVKDSPPLNLNQEYWVKNPLEPALFIGIDESVNYVVAHVLYMDSFGYTYVASNYKGLCGYVVTSPTKPNGHSQCSSCFDKWNRFLDRLRDGWFA